ncbi:MAG: hypothetical protein JRJ37_06440, partial [Deltaproteobacteria bacterium]|nr:hypothetical protein [Deltaproteobacteria bacterium]
MSKNITAWIERNKVGLIKDARLRGRMFRYGGRYIYGQPVARGTSVLFIDKLMLAISDTQAALPEEGADGWALVIDLSHMRMVDASWVGQNLQLPPVNKDSISSAIVTRLIQRYAIKLQQLAVAQPSPGVHKWVGIFHTNNSYNAGEIVAYNRSIFLCKSGEGVPGYNVDGWKWLDGIGALMTKDVELEKPFPEMSDAIIFEALIEDGVEGTIIATYQDDLEVAAG